jgi:tRNA threonylcarbamoyladenosine biosynthesis protein TsaE
MMALAGSTMTKILSMISKSEEETERIGTRLAAVLKKGDIVALYGSIGAGKTTFMRGVAAGLGRERAVKSPSFTLVNEYPGDPVLQHIDFYRLDNEKEIIDLGWTDYLNSESIVVIEWAEKVRKMLPSDRIDVYLEILGSRIRCLEFCAGDDFGDRQF